MAPRTRKWWEDLAERTARAFVISRGAVVWPEVEMHLHELDWIQANTSEPISSKQGADPHHLTTARQKLVGAGALVEKSVVLNGRRVSAWVDGEALAARGRRTEVLKTARAKRRLYRSFLGWAGNSNLCGNVAELVVVQSLQELRGERLWLPRTLSAGHVDELAGTPLKVGGPLDAAGHWARDPDRPGVGAIPFAIEVKNLRSTIYPWREEAWDLLAKVAAFPDHVPILIARRVHYTLFRCFADLGALAHQTGYQWFAQSPAIDDDVFRRVQGRLGFVDAARRDPSIPEPSIVRFFDRTLARPSRDRPGLTVMEAQAERWAIVAPIVERYVDLRTEPLGSGRHRELWSAFCADIAAAGLYRGSWAPKDAI